MRKHQRIVALVLAIIYTLQPFATTVSWATNTKNNEGSPSVNVEVQKDKTSRNDVSQKPEEEKESPIEKSTPELTLPKEESAVKPVESPPEEVDLLPKASLEEKKPEEVKILSWQVGNHPKTHYQPGEKIDLSGLSLITYDSKGNARTWTYPEILADPSIILDYPQILTNDTEEAISGLITISKSGLEALSLEITIDPPQARPAMNLDGSLKVLDYSFGPKGQDASLDFTSPLSPSLLDIFSGNTGASAGLLKGQGANISPEYKMDFSLILDPAYKAGDFFTVALSQFIGPTEKIKDLKLSSGKTLATAKYDPNTRTIAYTLTEEVQKLKDQTRVQVSVNLSLTPGLNKAYNDLQIQNIVAGMEYSTPITLNLTQGDNHLLVHKTDKDNKALEGATFALYNSSQRRIDRKTTNRQGDMDFGKLEKGLYLLKEEEAPKGYQLLDQGQLITIEEDGSITWSKDPKGQSAPLKTYISKIDWINHQLEYTIDLATGKDLAPQEMDLTLAKEGSGPILNEGGGQISFYKTGEDGQGLDISEEVASTSMITFSEGEGRLALKIKSQALKDKNLSIKIASKFAQGDPKIGFKSTLTKGLDGQDLTSADYRENQGNKMGLETIIPMENLALSEVEASQDKAEVRPAITISNFDEKKVPVMGAKYQISHKASGASLFIRTTDLSGKAEFKNIEAGEYLLEEVQSPEGILPADYKFEVHIDQDKNLSYTAIKIDPETKAEIKKISDTGYLAQVEDKGEKKSSPDQGLIRTGGENYLEGIFARSLMRTASLATSLGEEQILPQSLFPSPLTRTVDLMALEASPITEKSAQTIEEVSTEIPMVRAAATLMTTGGLNVNDKVNITNMDLKSSQVFNPAFPNEVWITSAGYVVFTGNYSVENSVNSGDYFTIDYSQNNMLRPGGLVYPPTITPLKATSGEIIAVGSYDVEKNIATYTFTSYVDKYNDVRGNFDIGLTEVRENHKGEKARTQVSLVVAGEPYGEEMSFDYGYKNPVDGLANVQLNTNKIWTDSKGDVYYNSVAYLTPSQAKAKILKLDVDSTSLENSTIQIYKYPRTYQFPPNFLPKPGEGTLVETLTQSSKGTYNLNNNKYGSGEKIVLVITSKLQENAPSGNLTVSISDTMNRRDSKAGGLIGRGDGSSGIGVRTTSIMIKKVDSSNNVLNKKAEFALYNQVNNTVGNEIFRVATDINTGIAKFEHLEQGKTYYVFETSAPEGYILSNEGYKIQIPLNKDNQPNTNLMLLIDKVTRNGDGTYTSSPLMLDGAQVDGNGYYWYGSDFQFPIVNEKASPKTGKFLLDKKDDKDTYLAGATFQLSRRTADVPTSDLAPEDFQTVETATNNQRVSFGDIPSGVYTLEEVSAPDGYIKDGKNYVVVVQKDGATFVVEEAKYNSKDYPVNGTINQPNINIDYSDTQRPAMNIDGKIEVSSYNLVKKNYPYNTVDPSQGQTLFMSATLVFPEDVLPGDTFTIKLDKYLDMKGVSLADKTQKPFVTSDGKTIAEHIGTKLEGGQYVFTYKLGPDVKNLSNLYAYLERPVFINPNTVPNDDNLYFTNTIAGREQNAKGPFSIQYNNYKKSSTYSYGEIGNTFYFNPETKETEIYVYVGAYYISNPTIYLYSAGIDFSSSKAQIFETRGPLGGDGMPASYGRQLMDMSKPFTSFTKSNTGYQALQLNLTQEDYLTKTYIVKVTGAKLFGTANSVNLKSSLYANNNYYTPEVEYSKTAQIVAGTSSAEGQSLGEVELIKTNEDGTIYLPNAKFTLKGQEQSNVFFEKSATTQSNGRLVFAGIPQSGYYILEETVSPPGYSSTDQKIWRSLYITVDSNGNASVSGTYLEGKDPIKPSGNTIIVSNKKTSTPTPVLTIKNYPEQKKPNEIRIKKVEKEDRNKTLSGAVFGIYTKEGSGYAEYNKDGNHWTAASDTSGIASFTELPEGVYYIKEKSAPQGYKLSTNTWKVEVDSSLSLKISDVDTGTSLGSGSTIDFTVENEKGQGEIHIRKVDENGDPLQGVTFDLYKLDPSKGEGGRSQVKTGLKTDASGELTVEGLEKGIYELIETKTKDGYFVPGSPYIFNVGIELKVPDQRGQDVSAKIGFNLLDWGTDKGNQVEKVYPNQSGNLFVKNEYSFSDGIKAGDYFTIKLSDTVDLMGLTAGYTERFDLMGPYGLLAEGVYDKSTNTVIYTFTNYIELYKPTKAIANLALFVNRFNTPWNNTITITETVNNATKDFKTFVDYTYPWGQHGNASMGSAVTEVDNVNKTFTQYIYVNPRFWKDISSSTLTISPNNMNTGDSGVIYDQNIVDNIKVWLVGDYTEENNGSRWSNYMPDSFGLNSQYLDTNLSPAQDIVKQFQPNGSININFFNTFSSFYANAAIVKIEGKFDPTKGDIKTRATFSTGSYALTWDNDVQVVPSSSEADGDNTILVRNYPNWIEFKKVDGETEEKKPLPGAKFELRKVGAEGQAGTYGEQESNTSGLFRWTKIPTGKYEVWETAVPTTTEKDKDGNAIVYKLPESAVATFEVNKLGSIVNVKNLLSNKDNDYYIPNYRKGSEEVVFTKKDYGGNILPGAEFSLKNPRGEVIATSTSDKEGKVRFKNLPAGEYFISETKAPDGYVRDDSEIKVFVGTKFDLPKGPDGQYIRGKDVSEFVTLKNGAIGSYKEDNTLRQDGINQPGQAGYFKAFSNFEFNTTAIGKEIKPGDYFQVKIGNNLTLGGIVPEGQIDELTITSDMGLVARGVYDKNTRTITYYFTEYVKAYLLKNASTAINLYVDKVAVPTNSDNFTVSTSLLKGTVPSTISDTFKIKYDGYYTVEPGTKFSLGSLATRLDEKNKAYTSYAYINPAGQGGFYGANFSVSATDGRYDIISANTRVRAYVVAANETYMPPSFGYAEDANGNPIVNGKVLQPTLDYTGYKTFNLGNLIQGGFDNKGYGVIVKIDGTYPNEAKQLRVTVNANATRTMYNSYGYYENITSHMTTSTYIYLQDNSSTAAGDKDFTVTNIENKIIFTKTGHDKTKKEDINLANVEFELRKKGESAVVQSKTSDKDGLFSFEKLSPGDYEVWEKQAPQGYVTPDKPVASFTVNAETGKIENIKPENKIIKNSMETSLEIIKKDKNKDNEGNDILLKDAVFSLYQTTKGTQELISFADFEKLSDQDKKAYLHKNKDSSGQEITEFTTDKDGKVTINGLTDGTYWLKEVKAPEGYIVIKDYMGPITVKDGVVSYKTKENDFLTISQNDTGQNTATVVNNKPVYPATGGIGSLVFTLTGGAIMGGALLAGRKRKKQ